MDIINRILFLLKGRDQKELTDYLGLNAVAFSEWKSERSHSYKKYLIEIADFFNVSIDYLVYGCNVNSKLSMEENDLLLCYNQLPPVGRIRLLERAETMIEEYEKQNKIKSKIIKTHQKTTKIAGYESGVEELTIPDGITNIEDLFDK